jgi:hypothetical protein
LLSPLREWESDNFSERIQEISKDEAMQINSDSNRVKSCIAIAIEEKL